MLTAYARGDVYHANDTLLTQTVSYRGEEGWSGRFIGARRRRPALAVRRRVPGRHPAPHAARPVRRLAADRESRHPQRGCARRSISRISNLFALNRFPGYDRWEDGVRVTYGADWALDLPGVSVRTTIGQSYRLSNRADDPAARHRPFRPLLRHRRPHQRPDRPPGQPHPPLPPRQGQLRAPPQRDRRDDRRPAHLCDDRLSAARPRHRSVDRGSARPRGDPVRRPGQLRALLVDLRLDGDRPDQPAARIRCRSPTASSRSATGSASSMTTIASSLA